MSRSRPIGLFALSASICLIWGAGVFLEPDTALTNDSGGYRWLAAELWRGGFPDLFRTPGYPLFLAVIGGHTETGLIAVILVQIILHASSALLTASVAARLTDDPGAGLLCGIFVALSPVLIAGSLQVMSETLFVFLAVAALYTALVYGSVTGSIAQGALWAAATMVRPSGLLLPLIVGLFLAFRRRAWKPALLAIAAYSLLIAAWAGYNHHRSGRFIISTMPDFAAYMYELPAVKMVDQLGWMRYAYMWTADPRAAERIRQEHEQAFIEGEFAYVQEKPANLFQTTGDPALMLRLRTSAMSVLRDRIPTVIGTHMVGALQVLRPLPPWSPLGAAGSILDALRLLLIAASAVLLMRRREWWMLAFFTVATAYAILLPGVCGVWRFRSAAEPVLAMAAGAALAPYLHRVWRGRLRGAST
ncbi:MAG: hypothetical protein KF868_14750 [Acidobacteria bacterium]|nr:hypothetical protein [Acidobacteriota bacterium]